MTESASHRVDALQLEEFLEFIYGDQSGYAYCLIIEPGSQSATQKYFLWPEHRKAMVQQISGQSSRADVYYSPGLFTEPSGKREHFKTSQVIWCEFDGNAPTSSELQIIPQPSYKLQSSRQGYEHWYWRLQSPLTDSKVLESLTKKITYFLSADHGSWNSNRVLRPPGLRHHESGKQTETIYQVPSRVQVSDFVKLPELPESIKNFSIGPIPKVIDVVAKYKWDPEPWAFFMAESVKEGGRSSALTKLAHFCVEMGMKNGEILAVLYSADDRWKKFKERSDRKERLISLVRYARTKELKDSTTKKSLALESFSFREFFEQEVTIDWVLPGVFPKGGSAIIAGPPEVGKTQISLQVAIHLALGKEFLGWKPERTWKSAFLSLEMGHADLLIFMNNMRKDLSEEDFELLHENLKIIPLGEPLKLDESTGQEQLNEFLEQFKPEGLFIDSFGQAMTGLNNDEDVNKIYSYLRGTVKNKYSCFNWMVHFPRKNQVGNRKPKSLDDLYGNRYIGGNIDLGLCAWPVGDSIELSFIKKRLGKKEYPKMIQRTDNLNFTLSTVNTVKAKASKPTDILDF